MRKPTVKNRYNLTPDIIRNLKTAKPEELTNEKYFWKNQNYPGKGCVSAEIGPYEDASFFLLVGEEGVEKFHVTVMMLCSYNFKDFYDYSEIENEYDLRIQEIILTKVNRLIDDGILTLPKNTNGGKAMYEIMSSRKLIENYYFEKGRKNQQDREKSQEQIKAVLKKRFDDVIKQLDDEDSTEYGTLWTLFGERPQK